MKKKLLKKIKKLKTKKLKNKYKLSSSMLNNNIKLEQKNFQFQNLKRVIFTILAFF